MQYVHNLRNLCSFITNVCIGEQHSEISFICNYLLVDIQFHAKMCQGDVLVQNMSADIPSRSLNTILGVTDYSLKTTSVDTANAQQQCWQNTRVKFAEPSPDDIYIYVYISFLDQPLKVLPMGFWQNSISHATLDANLCRYRFSGPYYPALINAAEPHDCTVQAQSSDYRWSRHNVVKVWKMQWEVSEQDLAYWKLQGSQAKRLFQFLRCPLFPPIQLLPVK